MMEEQTSEVLVDAGDLQCGHIFLHEPSMMLKFLCLFCEKTYNDINFYCKHLSEHMLASSHLKDWYDLKEAKETELGFDASEMDSSQKDSESCGTIKQEGPQIDKKKSLNKANSAQSKDVSGTQKSFNDEFFKYATEELDEDGKSQQFVFDQNQAKRDVENIGDQAIFLKQEDEAFETEYVDTFEPEDLEFLDTEDFETVDTENFETIDPEDIEALDSEDEETLDPVNLETLDTVAEENLDTVDEEALGTVDEETLSLEVIVNKGNELKAGHLDFETITSNPKVFKQSSKPPPLSKVKQLPLSAVKTYKIITLKNQIEELYSLVKQARISGATHAEARINNAICSIKKGIERTTQIVGETVITSLPVEVDVERTGNGGKEEYKCHACDKVFRNQHSLSLHGRAHYMESQSDVKVAHKCTDCNELFNKVRDLQLHIQTVHYPEGFKCKLCHKVLRSMGLLEVHMRKMHLQSKDYRCRLCGLANFTTMEMFEEHAKTHTNKDLFKCYICGREYGQEGSLKYHVTRHAEKITERCVVCGKVTSRITQHMKIHSPRPSRLLQCSICNKTFSFSSALSRHTKVMHKLPRTVRTKVVRKEQVSSTGKRRRRASKAVPSTSLAPVEKKVQASYTKSMVGKEEPKKVIVEMIENVMNRKMAAEDGVFDNMDCTVARYETIAAVQSITSTTGHS